MGSKAFRGARSSVTGKFVKESYAKSHPRTTQMENIPKPGHGDTNRSHGKKN
ncbi:MAG: hypothetical protein KF691_13085 [Phycisphaeraceae bacterium]|nr:hypothetical protein [Phycisphaeraceae bacterium]